MNAAATPAILVRRRCVFDKACGRLQDSSTTLVAQGPDRRPGNVIQNATERASKFPAGNSHVVVEPTGDSAFPGLDAQDVPIAVTSNGRGNQRGPFFFGNSPPPPPKKSDLQLTLGLPHLPPLFGAGGDPDLNPGPARSLAPALGLPARDAIPDPNKGPVTVIPGAVEVTSPTATPLVRLFFLSLQASWFCHHVSCPCGSLSDMPVPDL